MNLLTRRVGGMGLVIQALYLTGFSMEVLSIKYCHYTLSISTRLTDSSATQRFNVLLM